jgi:hypothetical protein
VVPVLELESFCPVLLVQVEQHRLLEVRLAVGDRNRVIVSIESMNECLHLARQFRIRVKERRGRTWMEGWPR